MLVVVMGVASLAGATLGVLARKTLPLGPLKAVVCVYLVSVGLWMLFESIAHVEHALLDPSGAGRWVLVDRGATESRGARTLARGLVGRTFRIEDGSREVIGVAREIHYPAIGRDVDVPEVYHPFSLQTVPMVSIRCQPACPDAAVFRHRW
jgi:hypothetical protein